MDFTYKVIGNQNIDPIAQGWVGDIKYKWMNWFKYVLQVDVPLEWEPLSSISKIEWYASKGDIMAHFLQGKHCKTINFGIKD